MTQICKGLILILTMVLTPFGVGMAHADENVNAQLAAHTSIFYPAQVVTVIKGHMWVAVGYGLANSIMIKGTDANDKGVIIIDTMEDRGRGKQALVALRQASGTDSASYPIKAIVFTHNHIDHTGGVQSYLNERPDLKPEIIYYKDLPNAIYNTSTIAGTIMNARGMYMYGNLLCSPFDFRNPCQDNTGLVNAGIGPFEGRDGTQASFAQATTTVDSSGLSKTICGVTLQFVYVPSETNDEIAIWLPTSNVLVSAEVVNPSFPNCYTIRGTKYRDPVSWFQSIDIMRQFPALAMVPLHGPPIMTKAEVSDLLRMYRDQIQFVHDQTIRLMNQGLTPDEIVQNIQLPSQFGSNDPYGTSFYGSPQHVIPEIYNGYLGWFHGDPKDLQPLPRRERATRYIKAMGGEQQVLDQAQAAYNLALSGSLPEVEQSRELTWAAELASYLVTAYSNQLDNPWAVQSRQLKAQSYTKLGYLQVNASWRNFYLTAAVELTTSDFYNSTKLVEHLNQDGLVSPGIRANLTPSDWINGWTYRLNPAKAQTFLDIWGPQSGVKQVCLAFTISTDSVFETHTLTMRNQVAVFDEAVGASSPVATLKTSDVGPLYSYDYKTVLQAITDQSIMVIGDATAAQEFMACFDQPIAFMPAIAGR